MSTLLWIIVGLFLGVFVAIPLLRVGLIFITVAFVAFMDWINEKKNF